MRRIYESSALRRDDSDPFSPAEQSRRNDRPRSWRWIPSSWISRNLIPHWLRYRVVSVSIEVPDVEYPAKTQVPFTFRVRNGAPFPVTFTTETPLFWTWEVDGLPEGSEVPLAGTADDPGEFTIDRGKQLRIDRRWNGMIRVSESEWEWAEPGEYTIRARLNVPDAEKKGLTAETTVTITPL